MFSTDDTIVAIATPAGRGGIGVVRISGPSAAEVADALLQLDAPLRPRYATFARTQGDQVVATYFPAPHSYTGEHVVEISAHGSPVVLRQIVDSGDGIGFASGRAGRVHAARISQRPDRSRAGGSRRGSDRRRHSVAGARGLRSAGRDVDRADCVDRVGDCSISSRRLEASLDFPDEGYHFVEAGETGMAIRAIERTIDALLCEVTARPADS